MKSAARQPIYANVAPALRFTLLLALIALAAALLAVRERPHAQRTGSPPLAALR
jgi:hypothetical protein